MNIYLSLYLITLLQIYSFQWHHVQSMSTSQREFSFFKCLQNSSLPSNILYTTNNLNYTNLFFSSIQNNRTLLNSPKPFLIITPTQESHILAAILCSKKLNIPLRTRSGGHDYEGLSYTTTSSSFVLVELHSYRYISINLTDDTAWVEAGATLGELYYAIATKSKTLAFPAGVCPTVGVGGHFSGGGLGTIMRSFGLAIDNIIDVRIAIANGEILDKKSMGEDLFWAIRGGGGASFGIILSYKLKLQKVPSKVTLFNLHKNFMKKDDLKLLYKWQQIAYNLDKRIFIRVLLKALKIDDDGNKIIQATFQCLFLGEMNELLPMIDESFPELELQSNDCLELSWIRAVINIAGYSQNGPLNQLLSRTLQYNDIFKNKSDFLRELITIEQWEEIFSRLMQEDESPSLIIDPFGGRMDEIHETDTPFPHRKGSLYNIQYGISWNDLKLETSKKYLENIRKFYEFMAPYVSKNPRAAYLNYRDLDLGRNSNRNASYLEASVWGEKYYKGNFRRLAHVKAKFDPENLFWNVQSIPPFL